jgi:hypothetical protein
LHVQGIALSEPHPDGTRTVIVAEPPPSVTAESLAAIHAPYSLGSEVKTHRLGFDGSVHDIVIGVPDDEATLVALQRELALLVFGSTYKAQLMEAPYRAGPPSGGLDLRVTAVELEHWLHPLDGSPSASFVTRFGETVAGVDALRGLSRTMVVYSEAPGLVLWWIPSGTRLDEHREVTRQFAIDSDLVLGAEITGDGLLVVARERLIPLDRLPPLRAETIELLAAVDTAELAQSYERNHPLAGPLDAETDWAPVYLSRELLDTEYGSLLNLADQLLKGWSNSGLTRYENFDYPEPGSWPFAEPVPTHLDVDELTYNWNTTGAGYTLREGRGTTYALNRTGALPVSYIPGGDEAAARDPDSAEIRRLRAAEERAYEYFAGRNDVLLVRVVQYASLYQMLTMTPSIGAAPTRLPEAPEPILEALTIDVLKLIRDIDGEPRERLIEAVRDVGKQYGLDEDEATQVFLAVEGNLVGLSDDDLATIREALELSPVLLAMAAEGVDDEDALAVQRFLNGARLVLPVVAARQEIFEKYSEGVAAQREAGWIRTPTVVRSKTLGSLASAVGGHNLSARVSSFRVDPSVPRNRVRIREVDGTSVVFVHPADASKISEVVRTTGKNLPDPAQLATRLERVLPEIEAGPPRSMHEVLGHASPPSGGRRPPPGASSPSSAGGGGRELGWGWARRDPEESPRLREETRVARNHHPAALLVERREDGTYSVLANPESTPFRVFSGTDVTETLVAYARDTVQPGREIQIHMKGVTPGEARGFLEAARVRLAVDGDRPALRGRVRSEGLRLAQLKSDIPKLYDFRRARVRQVAQVRDGKAVEVVIELPARAAPSAPAGRPAGRIRALVELVQRLTPDAFRRVATSLRQRLELLLRSPEAGDGLRLMDDMERELRILERETGVEIETLEMKFENELGDFHVVELESDGRAAFGVAC